MQKFNVGVVGYGWVAGAHIAAINATTLGRVTAVYSSRTLDSAKVSAVHATPIKVYNKFEDLLADRDIHVVSICSYPKDHARQAIAAAKAGKHLIIEKPLALSWNDCLEIQKAV